MIVRFSKLYFFILLLSFLCIMSCSRMEIKKNVKEIQEKPLKLPLDNMLCIGVDGSQYGMNNLTWIVYHDSVNCKPCLIGHLEDWNSIMENQKTDCIFIFSAKPEEVFQYINAYNNNNIKANVYLDTTEVFMKSNPQIPKEAIYHTLLLDRYDSVLLVGNPIGNENIGKIYKKIIGTKDSQIIHK